MSAAAATRNELLATAQRLRDQVRRLRLAAERADGAAYTQDMEAACDLERRAEQMEKEAGSWA